MYPYNTGSTNFACPERFSKPKNRLYYYPFGMLMPGRHANSESYRYGFQNQEVDNEIKGTGNSVNYKYRMHDPRLGRFFAVDPLTAKYPKWGPYNFSGNQVIASRELEGLEPDVDFETTPDGYRDFAPIVGREDEENYWWTFNNKNGSKGWTQGEKAIFDAGTLDEVVINSGHVEVTPQIHDGKFEVYTFTGGEVANNGISETMISNIDGLRGVTGFWETSITSGLGFGQGFSPSLGLMISTNGTININKSIFATSLVDWGNKSGLVNIETLALGVNYTWYEGLSPNGNDLIWKADGWGGGISAGWGGSRSLNNYKTADFYYRSGNRIVLGLTTSDSIERAVFDTLIFDRSDFLKSKGISLDSARALRNKLQGK